ncbi:MAG: universal stress protein [Polyangiaceae bacterium]
MHLILVPLDASQRAPKVLDTAIHLAQKTGAKLHLLRAVGLPPEIPMSPFGISPDGFLQVLVDEAKGTLAKLAANVPNEVSYTMETRVGPPWGTICEVAKELKADLIVIGSHGYGAVDRVIGTTAAKVVNHAACSVLVARNLEV